MTRRRFRQKQALPIDNRARHHTSEALALGLRSAAKIVPLVRDRLVAEGFPDINAARAAKAAKTAWDATTTYPPN